MYYAPILIITLNRYDHLINCIQSLQQNEWAKYTDLFIGLDFPPSEKYIDGFQKISKYLSGEISGFASVTIIRRKYNYGPSKNEKDLINYVFKKYDRFIFTEDDNIFSQNFIEYMDRCLEYYYDNNSVVGVCGYSYIVEWEDDGTNILMNNCFYPAWGHGMWKHKYLALQKEISIDNFRQYFTNKDIVNKIKIESPMNYCSLCTVMQYSSLDIYDITLSLYMVISGKMCVLPKKSLVRNCGWDGSGVNCHSGKQTPDYSSQEIDVSDTFELRAPIVCYVNNINMKKLNQSTIVNKLRWEKTKIIHAIIVLFGPNLYSKYSKVIQTILKDLKKIEYFNHIYLRIVTIINN